MEGMEKEILYYKSVIQILIFSFGIILSFVGFFLIRLIKGYDKKHDKHFEKTDQIPGIKAEIKNIKEICKERHKL